MKNAYQSASDDDLKVILDLSLLYLFKFCCNLLTTFIILLLTEQSSLPLNSILSFLLGFLLILVLFQLLFSAAHHRFTAEFHHQPLHVCLKMLATAGTSVEAATFLSADHRTPQKLIFLHQNSTHKMHAYVYNDKYFTHFNC